MNKLDSKSLHWLYIANAATYPRKQDLFYPFKARLLNRFGTMVGWELQSIDTLCAICYGSGKNFYFTEATSRRRRFTRDCHSCNGSGVYKTAEHWLQTWEIGPQDNPFVYHLPATPTEIPVNYTERQGRIEHDTTITPQQGHRCMMRLLLRHEPLTWFNAHTWTVAHPGRLQHMFRLWSTRERQELFPIRATY